MIGTDVQNTTLPDKKPATAMPITQKRAMIKELVKDRVKKAMYGNG